MGKKLKKFTNWEPNFGGINGFKKGIEITSKWFSDKNNLSRYNFNKYLV